jgi:hypothetical protein
MKRTFALIFAVSMLFAMSIAFAGPLGPQIVTEATIATPVFVDSGFACDYATTEGCMITPRQIEIISYGHYIKPATLTTKPIIRPHVAQVVDPASYGASEVPISNPGKVSGSDINYYK